MTPEEQAQRSIERAVCHLLMPPSGGTSQPFFASLIMSLQRKPVDAEWFAKRGLAGNETAAVDGISLFYYPPYICSLDDKLLKSLLLHEIWHVCQGHCWRRSSRPGLPWNVACDFVVNSLVKHECGCELGPDWLYDDKFKGLSSEEVYAQLLKNPPPQGSSGAAGQSPGNVIDASDSGADPEVVRIEFEQKIVQAAKGAGKGSVPSQFSKLIDEICNPKVPWTTALQRFVQGVCQSDYCWRRPSKKYMQQGLILPSMYSHQVGPIGFCLDVSGSTSDHWGQFLNEAEDVLQTVKPEKLILIQADCAVGKRQDYFPGDYLDREIVGGGGSSSIEAFEVLNNEPEPVVCAVYLTDGYLDFPEVAPAYPVLWIMTTDIVPPFGEIIRIN